MRKLKKLFEQNRAWVAAITADNPDFFSSMATGQQPEYLWIGCSDSRVPANEIIGMPAGTVFVHRNIANVVVHTDMNLLSVMQYAVEVLRIKHIIVCGHYNCGGIAAALKNQEFGLIDNWLRHIKDIYRLHESELAMISDFQQRADRLAEINVQEQVANICHTTIVQNAWKKHWQLTVHGWIYSIRDGIIRDLNACVCSPEEISDIHQIHSSVA